MFQVRPLEGYRWVIVDHEDRQVFEGTWRQCESWLDARENLTEGIATAPSTGFLRRWWQALFSARNAVSSRDEAVSSHPKPVEQEH